MLKNSLIYFAILFLPSLVLGLWQLFDDNYLKEKYEEKLSKEEIENEILKRTGLKKESLDVFDKEFVTWCNSWQENDMSECKDFCEEKYHEINKLQIEGFIDTNQRRHIEISNDHNLSFLNLDTVFSSKICFSRESYRRQQELKKKAPIRLRLKFEGEIADYQTEKVINNEENENNKETYVIGNQIPYERDIILDFYLIDTDHPGNPNSWKFVGTKAYNSYFAMRNKHYSKFWDKFLKRNKVISL